MWCLSLPFVALADLWCLVAQLESHDIGKNPKETTKMVAEVRPRPLRTVLTHLSSEG